VKPYLLGQQFFRVQFQRALPPEFSEEMVMNYLLDVEGTRRLVKDRRS
jgi:hypothetical protein